MSPELLLPAGTLKNMRFAFAYGADAVYAGQPRYSLRVRNNDFTLDNLAEGIRRAHALGKKLFVASNLLPHNRKVDTYLADIEQNLIRQALNESEGVVAHAAKRLNMRRTTLVEKLRKYGLQRASDPA